MKLNDILKDSVTVAIIGHVRPDGDCVSSCMALYNYLIENCKEIKPDVYLEDFIEPLSFMKNTKMIKSNAEKAVTYDVCIALDAADQDRLGAGAEYFASAKKTICIDHHISNRGFADINYIKPAVSSTSEVLYSLLDADKISNSVAECLYTGMVHDTGVFKFSNVTGDTLRIVGSLIDKGIDFSTIIDQTYYEKSYHQNQILGRALLESIRFLDGKCIVSVVKTQMMEFYGVEPKDLDGIVENLRNTQGVECAIFLYETGVQQFKVSLRSKSIVDVSKIASFYGGGGHIRAAGCTMVGTVYDVINNLSKKIEQQLMSHGE